MKRLTGLISLSVLWATVACAQENAPQYILIGREGFSTNPAAPGKGGSDFWEFTRKDGRNIFFDVFAFSGGHPMQYRELAIGGGRDIVAHKRLTWTQEEYLDVASGSKTATAYYLLSWTGLFGEITPRLKYQVVGMTYLPLATHGKGCGVLERAWLTYGVSRRWYLIAGTGGTAPFEASANERGWQTRPMAGIGYADKSIGKLELVPQLRNRFNDPSKPGRDLVLQIRWAKVFGGKRG